MSQPLQEDLILYEETQYFRQWWVWAILLFAVGPLWYGFFMNLLFGQPFGSPPLSRLLLIFFWFIFGLGLPLLIYKTHLRVWLTPDALNTQFFPFHLKPRQIMFDDIQKAEARVYRPILEYGGWGLRWGGEKHGKAYIVSRNQGVQLLLKDGQRLLLGSQKAQILEEAILARMPSKPAG